METIRYIMYGANIGKWVYQSAVPQENVQLMEPLTTMIRLAILHYKPEGTKISIHSNKIVYQAPTLLQGTIRWSNGDKRNDLHNLYLPISIACEMYQPQENREICNIFEHTVQGLINLQKSYTRNSESNLVGHCLNHYIDIIQEHTTPLIEEIDYTVLHTTSKPIRIPIQNPSISAESSASSISPPPMSIQTQSQIQGKKKKVEDVIRSADSNPTIIISNPVEERSQEREEIIKQENRRRRISSIYERNRVERSLQINYEGMWTKEEIHIIHEMIGLLEKRKEQPEKMEYIMNAIENLLEEKDNILKNLITRISNSI